MHLMDPLAIAAAEHSIDVEDSCFVPDKLMSDALIAASERGVVRVLVPAKHLDSATVRIAARHDWGPLRANGIQIYEHDPTMRHCRMVIPDKEMVSLGSITFDMRSFELDDEASSNVYDHAFADQMTQVFEQDLLKSRGCTWRMWQDRSRCQKFAESVAVPIRAQS